MSVSVLTESADSVETLMPSEIRYELPTRNDHPVLLWSRQFSRRLTGKRLLQEDILQQVCDRMIGDENVIGILLFGSVASGIHRWRSDIDLIFVYNRHFPSSGLINYFASGVEVQAFYTTLESLLENCEIVPYLLHMFSEAKVLFDRSGTVTPVVDDLRHYFTVHREIEAYWQHLKEIHQVEKKGPQCQQTTIIQRWDELESKFSDGGRQRTFFVTGP